MTDKVYTKPWAGDHEARIVHVVRAGKHTPPNDIYSKGSTPRLYITYELLDDVNDDGKNRWLRGFNFNQPMNDYGGERGARKDLLDNLGFPANDDEDLLSLAGMQCWVEVKHSPDGKWANYVGTARTRPRDGEFPPLINPSAYFDVNAPDIDAWNTLPKWIKDYCLGADDVQETGLVEFAEEARKAFRSTTDSTGSAGPTKDSGKSQEVPEEKGTRGDVAKDTAGEEEDVPY
jgi:hypothetical protein